MDARAHEAQASIRMAHIRAAPHGCAMGGRPCHVRAGLLGERLWRPLAPNGFADDESAWIDGLSQRVDIASNFAGGVADRLDPVALVEAGVRPPASAAARHTVAPAGSPAPAPTLLPMAPQVPRA